MRNSSANRREKDKASQLSHFQFHYMMNRVRYGFNNQNNEDCKAVGNSSAYV